MRSFPVVHDDIDDIATSYKTTAVTMNLTSIVTAFSLKNDPGIKGALMYILVFLPAVCIF